MDMLLLEIGDQNILYYFVSELFKKERLKIIIYLLFNSSITFFLWYYVTVFCEIFYSIQIHWIIGGIVSILLILVLDITFCIFLSILRVSSIKCKLINLYNSKLFFKRIYC